VVIGLPGVRFLTGKSGFLAICPKYGEQTRQAFIWFLVPFGAANCTTTQFACVVQAFYQGSSV